MISDSRTGDIPRIQELIWLSETNFWIFENIYDRYFKNTKSYYSSELWLLFANNSLEQSVLILHSLLISKDGRELSLKKVLSEIVAHAPHPDFNAQHRSFINDCINKLRSEMLTGYPNHNTVINKLILNGFNGDNLQRLRAIALKDGLLKLEEITKKFKSNFNDFRHQQIAHRDRRNRGVAESARRVFTNHFAESLKCVIKMLAVESYFWFNYVPHNEDLAKLSSQLKRVLFADKFEKYKIL